MAFDPWRSAIRPEPFQVEQTRAGPQAGNRREWSAAAVTAPGTPAAARPTLAVDHCNRERRKHKLSSMPELRLGEKARGPLSAGGIEKMITRRARTAKVPHIHPHQYRHTWSHEYRKSGGDRGDLKRLGG